MKSTIDLSGNIKAFTSITHDDVGCRFIAHSGEIVIITRKDGEFFDGSDGYAYDNHGIAWGCDKICSILVERIGSQY